MDYRIYIISVLIMIPTGNVAASVSTHVEQMCREYVHNSQRATEKLLEFLQYFQKTPSRNITTSKLMALINELRAADFMLLNKLNQLANNKAEPQLPQLFPKGNPAATKKLYQQAEQLISSTR